MKFKFDQLIRVNFFESRFVEKVKLIKNQQNLKKYYKLFLNFYNF